MNWNLHAGTQNYYKTSLNYAVTIVFYVYINSNINIYIYVYIYIVKRRYKQNLFETFYIVTNSFTLSLDSDPQTIKSIIKNFKEL